tara:strand:- start:59 stop:1087 length:1029 start_codon:yes stop_codon:yes gene_type:complete
MTNSEKCCHKENCTERGNAVVVTLVILVVAAIGVLAYMSGKTDLLKMNKGDETVAQSADSTPIAVNENPVVAKLNGEEIKRQDVIDLMNTMPAQMRQIPPEQLFPMALEQIINNKIIDEKASKSSLGNDANVKEKLALAKEQIIRAQFIENEVSAALTEERVQAQYEEYLKTFPELQELQASHILVDDEKLAKDIIARLDKGESFEALAKEYSKDGSAENGGDLGYFAQNEVVAEFANAAFATKSGEYTKTPVKTDFGYHVIKAGEMRKRPPAEFVQIKPFIEQELRREILEEVVTKLKNDVELIRFDVNGNPLPTATPEAKEPAAGESDASIEASPEAVAE